MHDVATLTDTLTIEPVAKPDLTISPLFHLNHPLSLRFGGEIHNPKIRYRIFGEKHKPVIVVQGGISADTFVGTDAAQGQAGWWADLVGPEKAIDTDRFCVLSFEYLGGCHGTTGPGDDYCDEFPAVATQDQAAVLAELLTHLGVEAIHTFVGASYGGMVGLAFAQNYPERLRQLVAISAPAKPASLAKAWRIIQRRVVRFGLELGHGKQALSIARGLAMTTYRTSADLGDRFDGTPIPGASGFSFPLESYLDHCGTKFSRQFQPKAFLCLSESIDLHEVQPEKIQTPTTLVGVPTDQLVPLEDLRSLCGALRGPATLYELQSKFGHDAFLKETDSLGKILKRVINASREVLS